MSLVQKMRTKSKVLASAGLVAGGLTAGAILGSTFTAGAATTSPAGSTSSSSVIPSSNGQSPGYHVPDKSGTVTALGSNSVTIDATTYAVTSSSDIDKNGEASVSALVVGDKVTFSTDASVSSPTIDKLHAGSESLDRPSRGPGAGDAPAGTGTVG